MTEFSNTFGITMRNFQRFPEQPDAQELIEFGVKAESLGYDSIWVWDHVLLGVDPHFPIIDALSLLTASTPQHYVDRMGSFLRHSIN